MDLELKEKRCAVTGSSSGIGFSIAEALLREEAQVLLNGRDPHRLALAVKKLKAQYTSERVLFFCGDLTKPNEIIKFQGEIRKKMGGLDVLVCNIGNGRSLPPLKETETEWVRIFDLNLFSAEKTFRALRPLLQRGKSPNAVFISSIAGQEATPAPLAYASAKAGIKLYAKNLSRLVGKKGIRVNVVSPGNILFPGSTWEKFLRLDRNRVNRLLREEVPLGRFGRLEEIADVVTFMVSPRASFMNGAHVVVDGGQTRS